MRIRIKFTGRKLGALGLDYLIGAFEGEGETEDAAIEDARKKAYDAGFEHVQPAHWKGTPVYEVLP